MQRPYHDQDLVFLVQVAFLLRIIPLFSTTLYFLASLIFCTYRHVFFAKHRYVAEVVSGGELCSKEFGGVDDDRAEEFVYVAPVIIPSLTTERGHASISSLYISSHASISGHASILENADDAFSEISDDCDYFAYLQWHIVSIADSTKVGLVIDVFSCGQIVSPDNLLFCVDILMDTSTFFHFPTRVFTHYVLDLVEYIVRIHQYEENYPVLHASEIERIFGITGIYDIPDATPIVLKTHWIRILQKKWRHWFAEKERRLRMRGSLASQRHFELTGKYFPVASIYQTSINTKTD